MPENARITRSKTTILAAFVLILIALSSFGVLDDLAKDYVGETRNESIGIYALSRGINAGISVLQSSEVGVGIISIQAGELLDPINDAVERFSSALVWAIGSLFLQEIILDVASHYFFKWAFFVVGLVAISALLFERYSYLFVRIFIFAAIIRFIVPAFVTLSFLASQMLLSETKFNHDKANLSDLCKKVSILNDTCMDSLNKRQLHKKSQVENPEQLKSLHLKKSESPSQKTKQQNEKSGWGKWVPEFPGLDKLANVGKQTYERLKAIVSEGKEFVDKNVKSVTYLLATIVIKNILLPLIFLAIAVKCSLPIARYSIRLASGFRQDTKELQSYLERKDEEEYPK